MLQIGVPHRFANCQLDEEEEEFYMLRPVNKTDHMQQGMNVLA